MSFTYMGAQFDRWRPCNIHSLFDNVFSCGGKCHCCSWLPLMCAVASCSSWHDFVSCLIKLCPLDCCTLWRGIMSLPSPRQKSESSPRQKSSPDSRTQAEYRSLDAKQVRLPTVRHPPPHFFYIHIWTAQNQVFSCLSFFVCHFGIHTPKYMKIHQNPWKSIKIGRIL